MRPIFLWLGSWLSASILVGQSALNLITGTPLGNFSVETFPSKLVSVQDGIVRVTSEIVPGNVGIWWVGVSYDWRRAVIYGLDGTIRVLDFDAGSISKTCKLPEIRGTSIIEQWLADVPGRGATFEWEVGGNGPNTIELQGMTIDRATPCSASFSSINGYEMSDWVGHGTTGVAVMYGGDGVYAFTDSSGTLTRRIGTTTITFPWKIPSEFLKGFTGPGYAGLLANNSSVFVMSLAGAKGENFRVLALRKSDQTWHVVPNAGPHSRVRAFGRYVAVSEATTKAVDRSRAEPETQVESAGRSEWRTKRTKLGPNVAELFDASDAAFSGRLHIFDVANRSIGTIETKQADSEVLLITDKVVYYRSSDRLYSIPISDSQLGQRKLLATDELIRDAHWAFLEP